MKRYRGVLLGIWFWGLLAVVGVPWELAADHPSTGSAAVGRPHADGLAPSGADGHRRESAAPASRQPASSQASSTAPGAAAPAGQHATSTSSGATGRDPGGAHRAAGSGRSTDHAGDHRDPYDLTHANASDKLADITEVRYDHMLASWLVFLLVVVGVGKLAWKPIIQGLEKREHAIAAKIEEAERNAQAAAERLREYEARLAQAAEEGRALIAKARQEAERRSAEILAAAEQAAERERARVMAEIEAARMAALEQIAQRSADLAVLMASRVLHRQLTADDHRQLIGEALRQFSPHHH